MFNTNTVLFKEYEDGIIAMGNLLPGCSYEMSSRGSAIHEVEYMQDYKEEYNRELQGLDTSEEFIW